jgi:hypothetical protein
MNTLNDALDTLADLVSRLESKIVWSAYPAAPKSIALRFADGKKIDLLPRGKGALEKLVERAKPAAFGAAKKTKIDPKVRDGLAILASHGASLDGFEVTNEMLDEIRDALAPDDATPFTAELYALNLYRKGGHFVAHKDTPRSGDVVGTLVVCLPWLFEGGALVVGAGEQREVFDWSEQITTYPSQLACAAFFGDVDHAVQEVTSGTRLTLSFTLRRAPKKRTATTAKQKPAAEIAAMKLAKAFVDLKTHDDLKSTGITLRVACAHEYVATKDTAVVRPIADDHAASLLKGRDAVVARAALAAGFEVSLTYCLWALDDSGIAMNARLEAPPTAKKVTKLRAVVKELAGDNYGRGELLAATDDGDEPRMIDSDFTSATKLGVGLFSSTGYYGNEATEAHFYVGAVLEIVVAKQGSFVARNVVHAKFGAGVVIGETIENGETKLRIRFANGEEKTLLERFVTAR